jgi:2-oxoglutarate ferredoxin oxidoreductase subunit alpha
MEIDSRIIFTDNSRLVIESLVQSGADVFIGYPITPANLLYSYASERFPIFLAAPDEITTLQWMSGFSATSRIPVTATSFPGFALMIESINMAYMMELPMIIILVQRLGPSTGTATIGSQGDICMLNGVISGGMAIPTFCVGDSIDCWEVSAKAVETSVTLRTPVIILTSKEEMMTMTDVDCNQLKKIDQIQRNYFEGEENYLPYKPESNLVPKFLPINNNKHQVRITSSTHNTKGIIQNSTYEALYNSKRLHNKMIKNQNEFCLYDYYEEKNSETILISYGITSLAAREAHESLKEMGKKVSLLLVKTLFPIPKIIFEIAKKHKNVIVAEENLTGQYRQILFGAISDKNISGVNEFGKMITPEEIINEVLQYEQ